MVAALDSPSFIDTWVEGDGGGISRLEYFITRLLEFQQQKHLVAFVLKEMIWFYWKRNGLISLV